ncbi:MAG TPA: type II toxin-antitoxin system VapB family antitoxin [Thermoanaerobaculia bacterium]|nr:type II toxin-antitoxin system VapB family antitoxin [Thermoanaerobaculia bacterium]
MKRTNVVLDEELLEKARRVSGERTFTAAITKALEEYVRKHDFWEAYDKWEKLAHSEEGVFYPGYLEELRPPSRAVLTKKKARVSAHEKRAPRSKR